MSQLPYQLHYAARLGLFVKMAEKHVGVVGGGDQLCYAARLGLFVKMAEKRVWVWGGSQVPYQLRYAARLGLFVKMAEKRVCVCGGGGGGAVRCPTPLALCGPARSLCKNGRETCVGVGDQSGALPIALSGPAWSLCKNGRETCVWGGGGGQSGALPHLRYVARLGLFVKMAEKREWVLGGGGVRCPTNCAMRPGLVSL